MSFSNLKLNKINLLPKTAGVYGFKKGAKLLYIGKAANIRERVRNHLEQPSYRDGLFLNQVKKIGYIKTDSEIEALILEANLIKKYQPKYNVVWRDDKNYFYVGITKEDFPRVFITHQPTGRHPMSTVGPFVDGKSLKATLKVLRKVFPYRSCYKIPNRPCLWYHLGRCLAPCLLKSKVIKEIPLDSLRLKKEIQRNARNIMKILKEGKIGVWRDLKKEMEETSKFQDFERAGKIRDQIKALERIMEHAKIFEPDVDVRRQQEKDWGRIQIILQKLLKIRKEISRIEAYDISNIVGQQATGSMVTFTNGQPDKNFYRKFKIKFSGKPNDIAMLKECLIRRFKHPEWGFPDLILIDGGIAQLKAALEIKNQLRVLVKKTTPGVVALAKRKNELFIENQKKPILLKKLPREIFNLILQLRDEAHRFARKYHLRLREIDLFPKS